MSYSARLMRMVLGWVVIVMGGLLLVAWWQRLAERSETSVFRPEGQIARVSNLDAQRYVVVRVDQSANGKLSLLDQACGTRLRALMLVRVMDILEEGPEASANWLMRLWGDTDYPLHGAGGCRILLADLGLLSRLRRTDRSAKAGAAVSVDQLLSESLEWSERLPCIEAAGPDGPTLILGNPWICDPTNDWRMASALSPEHSFHRIATAVGLATRYANQPKGSPDAYRWRMTVDHLLQANLDDWSDCLRGRKKCVAGRADLSLIDSIAVVVMDASTGDLLGLLCQGTQCRTKGAEEAEPINALLIEAPPASTTKLLHAMVLGKSIRVDAQELRNHLKTSVQLDGGVTKPNEWWERQVICDSVPLRRQAIGLPTGLSCDVMDGVNRLAREIGFNQHCDASEQPICGRMGLGDTMQSHWLQGFAGRLALGGSSPRQSLLTWHEYNQIRMGHQREPKGKTGQDAYWATAQSVQSVIGGGDSRIGALGLAHLGAYVWSVAEGRSPPQPKLLARVDSLGRERPPDIQRREAGRRDREAAALVFSGMQQVVEGEVPGWKGAGTAHAALRAAFGKSCAQACGVAAKTGTASFKDSKHAGTTLMVATVDMKHLSRWVGGEPKLLKGRKLALGVIAHVTNPEYRIHAASEIGIAMVSSFMKP